MKWYSELVTNYKATDRLIYEAGEVKLYENSKQYIEDTNRYHIQKELSELKKKNSELVQIANTKITQELELDVRWQEANEYQRKIYQLRNMRWLQQ